MAASTKSTCLEDLKSRILRMDLAPGSDLDETFLAARYGLSRTPLREVFQVLAGEGYIQLQMHRGARVTGLEFATMRGFFQTAPLIFTSVARLAAEHRAEADPALLRAALAKLVSATDAEDGPLAALESHGFHTEIGRMAGNPYMLPALARMLIDHTRLAQGFYAPSGKKEKKLVKKAVQQHEALVTAIETGSPEAASEAALLLWDVKRTRLEAFLQPEPLPVDLPQSEPV